MMTATQARDEHDPYYNPSEPEAGVLPSLAEAIIIAIAAVIALAALYQIHESLDRVGQSIAATANTRGVDADTVPQIHAPRLQDGPAAN